MRKSSGTIRTILLIALLCALLFGGKTLFGGGPGASTDASATSALSATDTPAEAALPAGQSGLEPGDATLGPTAAPEAEEAAKQDAVSEDGEYTAPEDVAAYIHAYGRLPQNFITKSEAMDLGWVSSEGNLWDVAYGKSIGGDVFGNREGRLPAAAGRTWYECDVNYRGGFRGGERIVYSVDGLIYYTDDHYETFEQLY